MKAQISWNKHLFSVERGFKAIDGLVFYWPEPVSGHDLSKTLPLPNPVSGLAICPSGNLLLKGVGANTIYKNGLGNAPYPDHFLSGTSDPASWMIRERYKIDKRAVFPGQSQSQPLAAAISTSQAAGNSVGPQHLNIAGHQSVQLPNGRTFRLSPPKTEIWSDRGECVYLGLGAKSLAVNPYGDLYIYGEQHDWILYGTAGDPSTWNLRAYTPFPSPAQTFSEQLYGMEKTQQPPPPPSPPSYSCLTCGKSDLDSRDLEVNPVTGNIWGCPKCGGKKLQKKEEVQEELEWGVSMLKLANEIKKLYPLPGEEAESNITTVHGLAILQEYSERKAKLRGRK